MSVPSDLALVQRCLDIGRRFEMYMLSTPIGLVLLEEFCAGKPEVSAEYVSGRLHLRTSDDTALRKLRRMEEKGLLTSRKQGRTFYFRLTPDAAEEGLQILRPPSQ